VLTYLVERAVCQKGRANMIFRRLDRWIDQHVATIGSVLIILVIIVYLVSEFVPDVGQWIITRGFFNVLLIALIVDLLHRMIELKGPTPGTEVFGDQQQTLPEIQKFVEKWRPETCDLLEYSTSSTRILLQELKRANVRIRLLMCHPDYAASPHERSTIEVGIDNVRRDFKGYKRMTVKLYTTPASLRGRNFGGKLINVGWYLYSHNDGELNLSGHDNAMVLSDAGTPEGQKLKQMFTQAFEALWNDRASVALPLTPEVHRGGGSESDVPGPRRSRRSS
jgi:hypothetical protein